MKEQIILKEIQKLKLQIQELEEELEQEDDWSFSKNNFYAKHPECCLYCYDSYMAADYRCPKCSHFF